MKTSTTKEAIEESLRQEKLKRYPGGIIEAHKDGGQSTVYTQEWHPDHAPTLEEALKHKIAKPTPRPLSKAVTKFLLISGAKRRFIFDVDNNRQSDD